MNALHRFERIIESLKPENDYYCLNLDFDAYCSPSSCCLQRLTRGGRYCKALAAVDAAYADRACWAKKSILNVCRRSVLPRLPSIPSSDSYCRYSFAAAISPAITPSDSARAGAIVQHPGR